MNNVTFYAHSSDKADKSDWQVLEDHLQKVSELSGIFASRFGVCECAKIAGQLHDLGKYSNEFQEYLERSQRGEAVKRGDIIHALQGAKYVENTIKDNILSDIIGNAIASHHGGMFDSVFEGDRTLSKKSDKNENALHYFEILDKYCPEIDEQKMIKEIINFCQSCQLKRLNTFFMLHFLTKSIFSCVVDADRCDTAGLEINDEIPEWEQLIQQLEAHLKRIKETTEIDRLRSKISDQCQNAGKRQQGIYTLSVPTGGGKTLSGLRFALEHAATYRLKHIIYVIPYLSILDQTAAKFNEIFADESGDLILEHHSNIEPPEDDDEAEAYRLLTSRWDSPIILTTMVQFLETIYSNKASKLRKFHNMADTVFVFDEIQSLPIKCIHLFNEAANYLSLFGKSTILLCTATQPHLDKVDRPVVLSEYSEIVSLSSDDMNLFERVVIEDKTHEEMNYEQIAELVKSQIDQGKSTLVILNTKKDARKFFEQCKDIICEKAFLSTDFCPAHRLDILEKLISNLDPKTKKITLCVSTQLIEAGVDISFDCVIRAQAGMDSIIQAAGRCNRNKEKSTLQSVYVIDVQNEKLSRLPEIKEGKSVTKTVFHEKRDTNLLSPEVINLFYEYYFYAQKDKMDYTTRDKTTTIHNLLNTNLLGIGAYQNRNNVIYKGLPCAFKTAADEFSVIDDAQTGIVVPFDNAITLVNDFVSCSNFKTRMKILRKMQKYTVSVYSNKFAKLVEAGAIRLVEDTFYLLSPEYYDLEEGLVLEAKFSFLCV